jgi:hypothetical protein
MALTFAAFTSFDTKTRSQAIVFGFPKFAVADAIGNVNTHSR